MYSEKEIGFMSMKKFTDLYRAYKDMFDLEMMMTRKMITYKELMYEPDIDDVIPM